MESYLNNELISAIKRVCDEITEELDRGINFIFNQSYSNIEFIIINDNPNNKLIKEYLLSLKDNRLRIYDNDLNIGLVKSLNRALKLCNGRYIARMDVHDYSYEDRLSKEMRFLKENDYDLVGCFIC